MDLKEKVIAEIKKIYDPEIPVNIYELGLIYKLEVDEKNHQKLVPTMLQKWRQNAPQTEPRRRQIADKIPT